MAESTDYDITLFVRDKEIKEVDPSFYSFIITDSVHMMLPSLEIKIPDRIGILREFLTTADSNTLKLKFRDIRFDDTEDYKEMSFSIRDDEAVGDPNSDYFLNQDVVVNAEHIFHENKEIKSKAYDQSSSDIINDITSSFSSNFKSIDIESTNDGITWYQPLLNDREFIENIILKKCYSEVNKSPFFCFIDNENIFNFKTYDNLYKTSKVTELEFSQEDFTKFQRNAILDFQPFYTGKSVLEKYKNREIYKFDDKGELVIESDFIYSYGSEGQKSYLPIYTEDSNGKVLSNIDLIEEADDTFTKNTQKGKLIQSSVETLFVERVAITCNYIPTLKAGSLIKIKIPIPTEDGNDFSTYYSDTYFIESSSIVWDNKAKFLYVKLIVSRKYINVNSDFSFKDKLIKKS